MNDAWRIHIPFPRPAIAARLILLALVVALQNLIELPRTILNALVGAPVAMVVVTLALAMSLALLFLALGKQAPSWRWLSSRYVQVGLLGLTLAAAVLGARTLGSIAASGFQPPNYPNDGTTLDHFATEELLHGRNPYITTDIVAAIRQFGQDPAHTTPLRRGAFANLPPGVTPTNTQITNVFNAQPVGHPERVVEFETRLSYPALSFLPLVPLVWAGVPSVVPFFGLCLLALAALVLLSAPGDARLWLGLLLLADAPLLDATVAGSLDVFYVLLLFIAWRWLHRVNVSVAALGLALAAKQLAWFFLPYYFIRVWWERGLPAAVARVGWAAGVFALINLPFIIWNPKVWLAGVLAPQFDPMFASGSGIIKLSLAHVLPIWPSWVYGVLEGLALLICVAWYWRFGRATPDVGFVLAVVPLFFAWRSLTTYFYYVAIPAVALFLARRYAAEIGASKRTLGLGIRWLRRRQARDLALTRGGD